MAAGGRWRDKGTTKPICTVADLRSSLTNHHTCPFVETIEFRFGDHYEKEISDYKLHLVYKIYPVKTSIYPINVVIFTKQDLIMNESIDLYRKRPTKIQSESDLYNCRPLEIVRSRITVKESAYSKYSPEAIPLLLLPIFNATRVQYHFECSVYPPLR